MQRQTQGSLMIVGAIGSGIFLVSFVGLMVLSEFAFSPALFLAATVALVATIILFRGFHEAPAGPAGAAPQPAKPAPSPVAHVEHVEHVAPEPDPEPAPEASEGVKPATMDAPDGEADDLKKIKGVGPKLEKLLNSMGFYHFHQVAAWGPGEVAWVDDNLEGFKGRVSRDDWVAQAKILADGGETEFSKAQS